MNRPSMDHQSIEELLKVMATQYGYDFHDYADESLRRRIALHMEWHQFTTVEELISAIHSDNKAFANLLRGLSVPVTEMFRDAGFFRYLRERVIPWLATFPFIRIWHAGCATGEEAWSMAILLDQAGLLDRCQIYATDYNEDALDIARSGVYKTSLLKTWQENFQACGGRGQIADYYLQKYNSGRMSRELQQHIVFANHNLVTDGVFGEMHLILCRNVLIYFKQPLQNRVLSLLRDSLRPQGVLCLGTGESLNLSEVADHFHACSLKWRVYRRKQGCPHFQGGGVNE